MEIVLTARLVSVVLGTSSAAQNVGTIGALGDAGASNLTARIG
jgi:hypothetical protein